MTTKSYTTAKKVAYRADKKETMTVTYKDWNGEAIVERTRTMKVWEVQNLFDFINKVAFVKLAY